jgi:hypothetical protein
MRRKNVGIAHCSECLTDPPEFVAEQPAPRALIARRIERSRRTATRIWWMSSESSTSRAPGSWLRSSESSSAASRARSRSRPDGPRSDNGTTRSSFVPVARACAEFSQPSLDSSEALFAAVDEFGLDLGERSLARSSVDDVDGVERHVDTLNTAAPSVSDEGRQLPERLVAQEVAHQGQDDSGTALPVSSTCNSIRPVTRGSFSCQTARRSLRRRSVSPRLSSRRSGVS